MKKGGIGPGFPQRLKRRDGPGRSMGWSGGWFAVLGAFTLAWAATLGLNLATGDDGVLYPVTSFPMFSTRAPTSTVEYWVQVGDDTDQRLPLAAAFDEELVAPRTQAPPIARTLLRLAACPTVECAQDLEDTVATMRSAVQARLGLTEPPGLALVVRTIPLDGGSPSEESHALA